MPPSPSYIGTSRANSRLRQIIAYTVGFMFSHISIFSHEHKLIDYKMEFNHLSVLGMIYEE